ncbi:MAG: hypothetical protein QHH06_12015 [Clostridiales bacterium]|nr:hypothetical protein [Eubacteriales bacterium]MDH7567178.1 hypothetical protein [Clostridiales bacterium]
MGINRRNGNKIEELTVQLEDLEKNKCSVPLVFAEMFKDEVNANDERKMYNGVKRVLRKYSGDPKAISAINEFTRVISGGASLEEILTITVEEIQSPSAVSQITVEDKCD